MADALISDAIGEWWIYPTATAVWGGIAFGAISRTGQVLACRMNDDGSTERHEIAHARIDDHAAPALWVKEGHRSLLLWTRHGLDSTLHCKVSDESGSLASLVEASDQSVEAVGTTSYTQIHHVPQASSAAHDEFWVLTRVTLYRWEFFVLSVDRITGAATWSEGQPFVQADGNQCYLTTAPSYDGKLRVCWGYNPAMSNNAVRYVEIDLSTGEVSSPLDSSVEGNVITGVGLPLLDVEGTPLLPQPPTGWSRRLFYVRPGPSHHSTVETPPVRRATAK